MSQPTPFDSTALRVPSIEQLGFDPQALRRKYDAERRKRLRTDGIGQYKDIDGAFDRYKEDPYITHKIERDALDEDIDVCILGGGFGGMLMAARLKEAGITNIRIIERAGDFGGTWYWNRYPGAQCDIESYVYLPLLEETGYVPKEKYSFEPEIYQHAQRIGHHFDLYSRACFQTQVRDLRWNEQEQHWLVHTDRNDVFRAQHVVMSSGSLNRPKLPGIPGLESFKGHMFHTSRWDYDYTGGDTNGNLSKLADKRVAVIGTGATAIQCIPHLGAAAKHLYVFQRTPSAVDERRNRPTDMNWAQALQPGWQAARNHNFSCLMSGIPQESDDVDDGWTELFTALGELLTGHDAADMSGEEMALLAEIADFKKMNKTRARVDATIKDPKVAEALKPWYRPWCKRPTFNDDFLPTFNRANVTLVDTEGRGVERLTERGIVVNGVEYEVDCLIFATGFEVGRTTYTKQAELEVIGRDGVSLGDYWGRGMRTFHGIHSHGFPNCFHMGFTQTGAVPNFTYMLDNQAQHIAAVMGELKARGKKTVEATQKAEADWVALVNEPDQMTDYLNSCTPGYYNQEGTVNGNDGFLQGHYAAGGVAFYAMLREWLGKGDLAGLDLR